MSDFSKPYRVDRYTKGAGILLYIKEGIISKSIPVSLNTNTLKRKEVATSSSGSIECGIVRAFCYLGQILFPGTLFFLGALGHFRLYISFSYVKLL